MTSVSPLASSTTERASEYAGRQTPWSNEAEQAVLGAMMLDQDAALKAAEILDDTMFYKESHRLLFRSMRSEEHTSELQSHSDLVCRLLLEKKKTKKNNDIKKNKKK